MEKIELYAPLTKDGFIGNCEITWKHIFTIIKLKIKYSFINLLMGEKTKFVKVYAISDNENNYNIYID